MSGAFDWLDSLAVGIGNVAGRAVDVAGQYAIAQANASSAARTPDQASAAPAATLSAGVNLGGSTLAWVAVAAVVIIGGVLILRR